jgi:hypothetical protein
MAFNVIVIVIVLEIISLIVDPNQFNISGAVITGFFSS